MKDTWFDRDDAVGDELDALAPGLDARLRALRGLASADNPADAAERSDRVLGALRNERPQRFLRPARWLRYALAACLAGSLPLLWWATRQDSPEAPVSDWSEQLASLSTEELAELAAYSLEQEAWTADQLEREVAHWNLDWSDLLQDADAEWLLSEELDGPFPGLD
jgi:hypothetical protein